jgi:uncharacterized protein YdbL (DUF1318 family)
MTQVQVSVSRPWLSGVLAAVILTLAPVSAGLAVSAVTTSPAKADIASAKALIDSAKLRGLVGEQGDGFLGFVQDSAPTPDLQEAVDEINAGRAAVYRETAAKTGVAPDAAGQAVATQLINKMPTGQYYRPLGGVWTRK